VVCWSQHRAQGRARKLADGSHRRNARVARQQAKSQNYAATVNILDSYSASNFKRVHNFSDLTCCLFWIARVVDSIIGGLDLLFFGPLRGGTAFQLCTSGRFVCVRAIHPSVNARFERTRYHDHAIEIGLQIRFVNQRGLYEDDCAGMFARDVIHPLVLIFGDGGVNDLVELFDSLARILRRPECHVGKFFPVDSVVRREDTAPKMADNFFVHWLAGAHQIAGDLVCVNHMSTQRREDSADRGLTAAGGAREPYLERSCYERSCQK